MGQGGRLAEENLSSNQPSHPAAHEEDEARLQESSPANAVLVSQQRWRGPLPPPDILSGYNVVENGAERLFSMIEKQSDHRMRIESTVVQSDNNLATRGQWFGLIVVLAVLGLAGYMAYLGATAAAAAVVAIDVVGLAAVFVYSRLSRQDTRERQPEDDEDE